MSGRRARPVEAGASMSDGDEAALLAALAAAEPAGPRGRSASSSRRLAASGRLRAAGPRPAAGELPILGIAYDSRRVVPGGVFVAVPGAHADGHDFVAPGGRRRRGRRRRGATGRRAAGDALQLLVDRSQHALAVVAAWWYGDPGRELGVIGITGTDGKTTTAGMAVAVLEAAGIATGLVSTAEQKIGAVPRRARSPTSPRPRRPSCSWRSGRWSRPATRRPSSSRRRTAWPSSGSARSRTTSAIFTNLSHEHLELHGTFEAYRAAKRSLFERLAGAPDRPAKPATLPGGGRGRAAGSSTSTTPRPTSSPRRRVPPGRAW